MRSHFHSLIFIHHAQPSQSAKVHTHICFCFTFSENQVIIRGGRMQRKQTCGINDTWMTNMYSSYRFNCDWWCNIKHPVIFFFPFLFITQYGCEYLFAYYLTVWLFDLFRTHNDADKPEGRLLIVDCSGASRWITATHPAEGVGFWIGFISMANQPSQMKKPV